ncbi:MAG TPA: hypothetical protein VFW75_13855 [Acetobacteraceae bacterium]|nr:hypothetical protein [Acetobacteraceae bacterium]
MPPYPVADPFQQFADAMQTVLRRQPQAVTGQTPVLTRPPAESQADSLQARLKALATDVAAAMRARMPATGTRPPRPPQSSAVRSGC